MDELACFMDWDLEAILNDAPLIINDDPNPYNISHFFSQQDDELLCSFPEFSETTNVLIDEYLSQELYKPAFNPVCDTLSSQTIVTSSITIPKEVRELQASEEVALQVPIASKYIRSKKNKKKSVVKKMTTMDGSFCDEWAWRKYGQKPIKGSPYPRSYYRCSSSKGCLARKQVERNRLDPKVFLVTYTNAEHNHPQQTRRNSLAGSTRKNNINNSSSSAVSVTGHSPRTPLAVVPTSSNVEEVAQQRKGLEKEEDLLGWLDDVDDAQLCDGWVPSKELEEFINGCNFMDGFADI